MQIVLGQWCIEAQPIRSSTAQNPREVKDQHNPLDTAGATKAARQGTTGHTTAWMALHRIMCWFRVKGAMYWFMEKGAMYWCRVKGAMYWFRVKGAQLLTTPGGHTAA
jgi:hypothetical protein